MLPIDDQVLLAERIVSLAKQSARIDTGSLRRSISFRFEKGILTFKQLYYGQWNGNSKLEDLANKMIPNGTPYMMEYSEFGGKIYTQTVKRSGRRLGTPPKKSTGKSSASATTNNLRALIDLVNKNRARAEEGRKKDGK